ncbi:DUF5709 domain-containing protein [Planotetraspora sp. A-T 1434]|uniref:DUF5709 domain-containing protein n=1 Tax=Planotetraspora sp. A-T 1434 TaxID=2979219 RepID=UPI0021C00105|nr:DUF5709 domain-containing protein [Planotetraspora sp. A-T 1434]MCT9930272.1 DUF5709 domain-containing protein [Planotetraspora sp. A-T 1434]
MREHRPEPDPRSPLEDEGIPDLQEGAPEQRWAEDPQEMPVPADRPVGVDEYGTTAREMAEGEPLDLRLSREVPEETPGPGGGEPPYTQGEDAAEDVGGDLLAGDLSYDTPEPRMAGRLIDPSEGVREDTVKELIADEIGPDGGGYAPEETAMRVDRDV